MLLGFHLDAVMAEERRPAYLSRDNIFAVLLESYKGSMVSHSFRRSGEHKTMDAAAQSFRPPQCMTPLRAAGRRVKGAGLRGNRDGR